MAQGFLSKAKPFPDRLFVQIATNHWLEKLMPTFRLSFPLSFRLERSGMEKSPMSW
jgi:hypothetical protein